MNLKVADLRRRAEPSPSAQPTPSTQPTPSLQPTKSAARTMRTTPSVSGVSAASGPDDGVPSALPGGQKLQVFTKRRAIAMLIYAAAIAILIATSGLPTDPLKIFLCLWAGVIAWNSDKPLRSHLGFARDWAL